MRNLFVLIFSIFFIFNVFSQEIKPAIQGTLATGEAVTGYNSAAGDISRNSYLWHIANDANGISGSEEVGKQQTYKIKQGEAGKYIRFGVVVSKSWWRKVYYYSTWNGPIKNSVPVIQGSVSISGTLKVGNTLTANYVYDADNYPESGSTFRWYLADNSSGANAVLISSAGSSLVLLPNQDSKFIRVEITPRDINGSTGANYSSSWYGPIEKADQPANQPPVATNVRIRGNPVYCGVLTGLYDYVDQELDVEGGTSFRWLRSSGTGDTPVPIPNQTSNTYTVSTEDQNKYIYFEVTPKAISGAINGSSVLSNSSSFIQGAIPSVTFAGTASVCQGASAVLTLTFTGSPPFNLDYTNGTSNFTLSTSNSTYQLTVNGAGTYKGTKLTDILNCPVTNLPSTAVISAKPQPELDFTIAKACYTGDTTIFINNSSSKNTIKKWSWNFGDIAAGTGSNTSALESPKHKYPAAGNYSVWLSGENNEGCKDTTYKTIVLGNKPSADILWDKECFSKGMVTTFQNNSANSGNISKYSWTLSDASKIVKESTNSSFTYTIPAMGNYNVKLKITTDVGCTDSIIKVFSAKTIVRLQDSMYNESFEVSNKNWNIESNSKNNWVWGLPQGTTIKTTHSGTKAFYTSFPQSRSNQQLTVTSPCFDFTNIQKPFFDFWINYLTQDSKEGAVLQYMQDGETAWTTAGSLNSGQNWYNNSSITAKPGNQQTGWSGNSNGWVQARQSLDALSNKTNIRFRLVYASASDATSSGEFAFDDIFIGQRAKKVLVEHFTNLADAFSNKSNITTDSILTATGINAVGIQYHTAFPGADSLNNQNKANPAARALFYGVGKVPVVYLDGGWSQNYIYDFSTRSLNTNDINNRSFDDPKFNIAITSGILNNVMSGKVNVKALKNFTAGDNSLYLAIVEDINVSISGKTSTLKNVLKYMYPSAAGTVLSSAWIKDQTAEVAFSWPIANVYNLSKLKVVAFIQNNQTREVYQVEMANNTTVTSSPELNNGEQSVMLYPNPVNENLTVSFGSELKNDVILQIINTEGKVINETNLKKGNSVAVLPVNSYPVGLYLLKVKTFNEEVKTLKFLISK